MKTYCTIVQWELPHDAEHQLLTNPRAAMAVLRCPWCNGQQFLYQWPDCTGHIDRWICTYIGCTFDAPVSLVAWQDMNIEMTTKERPPPVALGLKLFAWVREWVDSGKGIRIWSEGRIQIKERTQAPPRLQFRKNTLIR